MIVVCDAAEITAGDISGMLTTLKSLTSDRSSAMGVVADTIFTKVPTVTMHTAPSH